jgi:hypothetical protein
MISRERAVGEASELMLRFAERTGLTSDVPPQRYLWTDAFAVCNFLGLARATGEQRYSDLALRLVDQVHHVLGRHRADDPRTGWISGLGEQAGDLHPTRAGLRIGKKLPERPPGAPFDESLEWDRDGQYFHYLTRWMHGLDQVARSTGQSRFNTWARELAEVAHRSFTCGPPVRGGRRMVWKMSIDLSRPLVPSMGQHDPLDGVITCLQLQTTAAALPGAPSEPSLAEAVADFALLIERDHWATADPLGLGGLLADACRVAQLMKYGTLRAGDLLDPLLAAALEGLSRYARQNDLREPASRRLAFRELGLAIGISAIERIERETQATRGRFPDSASAHSPIEALARYTALGSAIESFWRGCEPRRTRTWAEHRDINDVMLATCLVPEGLLVIPAAS